MLQMARMIIGYMLEGAHKSGNRTAAELSGMGSRELCDLGIGASEIPYILSGGICGRQEIGTFSPGATRSHASIT